MGLGSPAFDCFAPSLRGFAQRIGWRRLGEVGVLAGEYGDCRDFQSLRHVFQLQSELVHITPRFDESLFHCGLAWLALWLETEDANDQRLGIGDVAVELLDFALDLEHLLGLLFHRSLLRLVAGMALAVSMCISILAYSIEFVKDI